MKDHARSLPRLVSVLVLTLTLMCSFAYFAPGNSVRAVSAQSTPPSGSFGFLINTWLSTGSSDHGAAVLGVMNFDKGGTVAGTYSINPDGSGTVKLGAASGQSANSTFAFVVTDGGSGLLLLQTDGTGSDVSSGTARLQ
jgi:hypothetical protein